MARPDFRGVAQAVASSATALGMLPLENAGAGPVPGVMTLTDDCDLAIRTRHALEIRLHLLACPGASHETIRVVASHPMGLAQCRHWLAGSGLQIEEAENTGSAAMALSQSHDIGRAVIASARAADIHHLDTLISDIHDRPGNSTIFGVVARRKARS